MKAQEEIASVFRRFINQVEANPNKYVREKLFTERVLSFPPDMLMSQDAVFFHDFQNGFGKFIFYGIEMNLAVSPCILFVNQALWNWCVF